MLEVRRPVARRHQVVGDTGRLERGPLELLRVADLGLRRDPVPGLVEQGRLAAYGVSVETVDEALRAIARGTGIALKNINRFSFLMK